MVPGEVVATVPGGVVLVEIDAGGQVSGGIVPDGLETTGGLVHGDAVVRSVADSCEAAARDV